MQTIKRDELYKLVWLEPISKIAPRYGLSDRGMGKLCARHNIPVPPRGYWARKAARKRVQQPPLPPGRNVEISFADPKSLAPPVTSEPLPPEIEFERDPANFVVVESNSHITHPLVKVAATSLRGEKPYHRDGIVRRINCLDIRVSPASLSRALRILQALIRALEQRGHSVVVKERQTQVVVLGEAIGIVLRERLKKTLRDLTVDEQRRRKEGVNVEPYELRPTGELLLTIEHGYGRTGASDGKNQKVEDLLNKFIELLLREAFRNKAARAERERDEQRRAEVERRRKERETLLRQEEALISRFDHLVAYWKQTQERRAFFVQLQAAIGPVEQNSPLGKWLEWAQGLVESCDPLEHFKRRGQQLKLYFAAYRHEILEIKKSGFQDPQSSDYERTKTPAGVTLSDRRPSSDWMSDLLQVDLPEDLVLPYETTRPGYEPRTFCVPARVLNEHLFAHLPQLIAAGEEPYADD